MIKYFRWFANKVLPLVYDDSLSYYEVLCKMSVKLNEVIEETNDVSQGLLDLKEYVDSYFDSLDIQQEINNVIQQMIEDGDFQYFGVDNIIEDDKPFILNPMQTPEMYGAVGDGVHDDTEAIQTALNNGDTVLGKNKTYLVTLGDNDIALSLVSNRTLNGNNSKIKLATNSSGTYKIFYGNGTTNFTITDLIIEGDKATHTGDTGETAECIALYSCKNGVIQNCKLSAAWGDGIRITNNNTENIVVDNCTITNCGRNGISIENGDGVIVSNCFIKDMNRTAPMCCIDVEPYLDNSVLKDIKIDNCVMQNTHNTLNIAIGTMCSNGSVYVSNCSSDNYWKVFNLGTNNKIVIDNCTASNIRAAQTNSDSCIDMTNMHIIIGTVFTNYRNSGIILDIGNSRETAPLDDIPSCYNVHFSGLVEGGATAYAPLHYEETGSGKVYGGNYVKLHTVGSFTNNIEWVDPSKVAVDLAKRIKYPTSATGWNSSYDTLVIDVNNILVGDYRVTGLVQGVEYIVVAGTGTVAPYNPSYTFVLCDGLASRNFSNGEARKFVRWGSNIYESYP